jgi:hypothetical protein
MAFPIRLVLCFLLLSLSTRIYASILPSSYDVVWDKPGKNQSADSMPLGGGDIGVNAWSENGSSLLAALDPVYQHY